MSVTRTIPRRSASTSRPRPRNTEERCAEIDGIEECFFAIQTNNVEVDERGFVYLFDRANTGLHIVELTGEARQLIDVPSGDEEPAEDDELVAELP